MAVDAESRLQRTYDTRARNRRTEHCVHCPALSRRQRGAFSRLSRRHLPCQWCTGSQRRRMVCSMVYSMTSNTSLTSPVTSTMMVMMMNAMRHTATHQSRPVRRRGFTSESTRRVRRVRSSALRTRRGQRQHHHHHRRQEERVLRLALRLALRRRPQETPPQPRRKPRRPLWPASSLCAVGTFSPSGGFLPPQRRSRLYTSAKA